jgi:carboxylesterase
VDPDLALFPSPQHQTFSLGDSPRRALLIHGFPGTPAEVRPLADILHQLGWQVRAPLLPGFGSGIAELNQQHRSDWVNAAVSEWQAIQPGCQECMLLGYSMGAAVALHTAAVLKPDKLVLVSPFWRAPGPYHLLVPIVRRLAPNLRLFKNADFGDPRLRQFFAAILPESDLDDPKVQQYIRTEFTLPLAAMEEVIRLGREAYRLAANIQAETLIVQGSQDPIVRPADTRRLIERLEERLVCYYELPAAHDLLDDRSRHFDQLAGRVADFAGEGCLPIALQVTEQMYYQHEQFS